MGEVRIAIGSLLSALAILACASSAVPERVRDDGDAEPSAVPDPPPRYALVSVGDAAASDAEADGELHVKCGRDKPYVCPLDDDAGFACSSVPCLPDCTRIGCVGGDVCTACDGGYRCVAPDDGC